MRSTWTFHSPGQIVFGRNAVTQLGDIVRRHDVKRAQIVSDRKLVDAGVVKQTSEPLEVAGVDIEVFDEGQPDPPVYAVQRAAELALDFHPDVIIGVGGGSNMDLAKVAATVHAHGGTSLDYAGDQIVPGPITPLILVPTTSGTGSEVTAAAVLNDTVAGCKFAILSNYLRPVAAIVDPMLTVSCPPSVTADSGIDALTHAVESYMAVDNDEFPLPEDESTVYQGRNPLGNVLAERAITLIGRHLRRAVEDGTDLEAREGMSLAATIAGMSFSNVGVAVVHVLEYVLAEVAHTSHGRGCGILLPYVMKFNQPTRASTLVRISELLGEDVSGLSEQQAADIAIDAVQNLKRDIGIPNKISEMGVQPDQIEAMAEKAITIKRILRVNPRPVNQQQLGDILHAAM